MDTTYDQYAAKEPDPRFSDWLRTSATEEWETMLNHRFVQEITADRLSESLFETYLLQEYAFVDTSASTLGYAIAQAPSMTERRQLADALDGLVTDQRAFFERSFAKLGVPTTEWTDPPRRSATNQLSDIALRGATVGGYEETLAPMLAAEWLYATWCGNAAKAVSQDTIHGEWIHLHDTDDFHEHVDWLRNQLDTLGPELPTYREQRVQELFRRTLSAEASFHNIPFNIA